MWWLQLGYEDCGFWGTGAQVTGCRGEKRGVKDSSVVMSFAERDHLGGEGGRSGGSSSPTGPLEVVSAYIWMNLSKLNWQPREQTITTPGFL